MPYKLVMFDFDGTLADSFALFLDIGDRLSERYGFRRFDRTNVEALRRLDASQMMRLHDVRPWKLPFIARDARMLMGQDIGRVPLFDGIGSALAHLAGCGVVLAIVTSNSRANVLTVLGPDNLPHITHFECGVSLFGKAARVRRVLAKCKVAREEAMLVGDEIRDATAARQAGVAFGAVGWGYTHAEALLAEGPQELFREVAELKRLGGVSINRI